MKDNAYSIVEARDALAMLVHRAEEHSPVVITRRGRPVAVIVSYEEYEQQMRHPSFFTALNRFYAEMGERPDGLEEAFENLRDRSEGRSVPL